MSFEERLRDGFENMMAYRLAVGYADVPYRVSMPPFIDYCVANYPDAVDVTREMIDAWLAYYPYSTNGKAVFISLLREYTKHLCFLGGHDFIPDEDYSTKRISYYPRLMSDDELKAFITSNDSYTGKTYGRRLHPEMVLPVYTRLLYCCGMRPQEPPALLNRDVNLTTGDIYIRQSKLHKDRHIIMSEDMRQLCIKYNTLAANDDRIWFFQRFDGKPYTSSWYWQLEQVIWKNAGLAPRGSFRPYDLRHLFASHNITRWLEAGKDVMELMPSLSAYMGHSEISSTLYYIHLIPERLRKATSIDWAKLAAIYGEAVMEDED